MLDLFRQAAEWIGPVAGCAFGAGVFVLLGSMLHGARTGAFDDINKPVRPLNKQPKITSPVAISRPIR